MRTKFLQFFYVGLLLGGAGGCETPQFPTVVVYDSPNRFVRLEVMPEATKDKGYAHPAYLTEEQVSKVMEGLYVQIDNAAIGIPFLGGDSSNAKRRAFSDAEIKFFSPLLVKGLAQATPEEIVTFFETAKISDVFQMTTSGGVFAKADELHFVLSNYNVKTPVWQDTEEYRAPYRLRPLDPIDPQPGRLLFDPPQFMTESSAKGFADLLKGGVWQVAVRFKEISK